ncbi:hypothetical protein BJ878DRAFT_440567 [Calycina marina]|uniref:Carrier domain-containing protein n=1 Tax=Calycina marina TaxID=1763456 RepID=A0A9P8CFH4_9HELO|nr:hypothetical protein BJ878DRAFT_440567 [Calycina marina]
MFLQYSSTLLSQEMASNIAATLSKIIHQILERTSSPLRQLDILSDNDREHICGWNSRSPEPTTPFLHELVAERAAMHPDTPAIFSWDGELTYGELDSMANRFAHYLVSLGVGPEVPVIICFPKTLWTVVTMLAILKSGGTFVPLDPAAPVQRQNSIIKALGATLAVMDPTLATQFDGRIQRVITDLPALIKSLPSLRRKPCASITESTAAYVMFSSGSTGEPKGITIHHGAATASIPALGRELGLTPNDRVLQFAAWTFDVCLGDVFPPLVIGASVCIPSDEERVSDLSGAINRLRVTYATLTPTIAGLLTPDKVPGLKTLVLGGEAATQDNYSTWTRHVNLYNAFGPTETVVWNLATGIIKPSGSPANVGSGMNAIFWIVDPQNNDLLVPIGSVGELVIEGPVVGRGYLNDPVKTAAAFIEHPPWSRKLQINVPYNARAYRTGDLARYNADGTAQFMGRKDAQVKLHGQRMDLAGIEHQIKLQLSKGSQVVVDLVKRKSSKVLGAFICLPNQVKASGIRDETLVPMNDELHSLINNLASELQKILPKYMVPGLFLIPKQMPTTPSLKTDRKRLLAAANNLDDKTFSSYTVQERRNHGPTSTPTGNVSLRLRSLWAEALAMSPDSISGNDSLFELGGDSLTAMKLVSRAREEGLCFSVTDVFKHPLLDDLAAVATAMDAPVSSKVAPYSLLIENAASGSIKAKAVLDCRAGVMDIYPCTSLQESFMATTIKDPGAYVNRYVFSLPPSINLDRFKNAWALVVDNLPILRTRIIQADCGTLYQIVTDDKISWKSTIEVARYLEEDLRIPTGLGDSLSRYAIVQNKLGQPVKFIWTVHHSLYDGWCFDTLLDLVSTAYEKGSVPQTIEFNRFMRYIQDIDLTASDKYWKDRLLGANQPTFPAPLKTFQTPANESTGIAFPLATQSRANITLATILRAAWAMIVARYSDSDDVVFGVTSIGRNADVPGIDMIVGPTITSIPVRVKLSRDQTIASFLADVQAEAIDSIPFEQVPMRKIKSASADAALSCEFQNLLVIQSDDMETSNNSLGMKVIETAEEMLHPYSLVLECSMTSKGINLRTQHDTNVISTAQIERLLYQFKHVVQQLDAYAVDQTIRSVNLMSPEDHSQLSKWNKVLPASANVCAHHLIQDQVLLQPNAPAISAWDASFTYKELDNASSKLARHLISIGVGPEVLVALCFEKSAWAVVAMLAVMKSGGAFVPLDPSHPMSRKQEIVGQANAKIILASLGHSAQDWGALKVVTVDSSWISKVNDQFLFEVDIDVSPDNILYVLFTSGSSGQPKGFIIEHAAFISSALSQGKATFMSSESRIFQFSSYSFDVSILEIVTGLIFGGCICIASADATKDITKAIDDMQVTWACVTPSVMRLVQPDKVPTLQTLVLGGEAVSTSDVAAWSEKVNLVLGYGPSEVSVAATTTDPLTLTSDPDNFGTPGASLCWVVDANDYHTLAPLGTTGEIMIEGPILARGYLNDPVKTAAAFITDIPQWLKNAAALRPASWIPSKKPLRLYRTGDLGKMNPDGSINFVSRKDRQVKVRGQRVELSEVEHHLSTFPEMRHFVVEFPKQGPFMKKLVVVMSLHEISICSDGESQLRIASGNVKERATTSAENICNALAEIVPSYMVPTVRIVVEDMPYTPSGKINRVRVKNWLNTLDDKTYRQVIDHDEEMSVEEPANDLEQSLRRIWATSLQMDEGQVSLNKSFFQLAGDSILAMRVMALARDDGINVGVQDILRCRNIPELALRIDPEVKRPSSDFRLASPTAAKLDDLIKVKLPSIGKGFEDVEDMYPCSALQQGILISQLQNAGAGLYEDWAVFEVVPQRPGSKVSASQLEKAWQAVVARHGILRAILAQDITKYGVFGQLVLSNYHADTSIVRCNNYDEWRASRTTALDYSKFQPPHRLTICTIPDGRVFCEIETNHAINDGESSSIMIRDFALAYDDLLPKTPAPRYSSFISFIQQQSAPSEVYWKSYLAGLSPCHFPTLVDTTEASRELLVSQIKTTVPISSLMQFCRSNGTSLSALFQLIWALVLRTYTGSDDVCFGFINSGRDTPIDGIQDVVGPLLSVLTSRVAFAKEDTASQILNKLQSDFFDSLPYQHFGMSEIQRTLGIPGEALFNSGMSFRKSATEQPKESISFKPVDEVGRTEYDVTIVVDVTEEGVDLFLCHWTSRLSAGHATNVIGTFDALLSTVIQNPTRKIGDLKLLSHRDMKQIAKWNTEEPELVQECIHTAFEQQVDIRPRAPAVCSWDGQLTYRGLDILAGKLAQHLRSRGVGPEVIVPLCFEKSVYVLISMVAVLKAGGVIAVLDPANPVARLHEIAFQVQAKLVLTSSANTDKFASVVELTLTVDQEFLDMLPPCRKPVETPVTPDNAAYIISTSGSSGKPKIVVIPHAAFCSGAKGQAIASNIGPDSRILQFASYSFDVSIMETFTSLMYGACVCMPSENSRSTQIVELINEMKITWAFLTPSVIKTISPAEIPDLKTLILGGEALHQSNLEIWSEKLHLLNGYGPSECSVAATANTATTCYTSPANIGRAIGGRCWIVDSQDHNELVPVGVIGELLIQGPILARGYLGDIEKTAAAFISKPTWSKDVKYNRYYKTGDLCRYSSSGDIMFVGRKDTQVKVRGQRLELGEVEHNLSLCPQISHAAVFAPKQGPFKGQLIAALSLSDLESSVNNSYGVLELVSGDEKMIASSQIAEATESMNKTLPNYMIPTSWAVLKKIPLLPSGKLDRTALRVWLDNLDSATHRQILELEQDTDDTTLSQTEKKIQAIWSTVLNTPAETIGSRTNFFSIGGNSITAMQVVARCRLEGVTVGIQDILRLKTVAQLAAFVDAAGGFAVDMEPMAPELEVIPPFSLFPVDYKSEDSLYPSIDDVAAMCHISADQIEDMFPCGPWQDECMAMTAKQPKIYIARNVFSLPTTLDIERFKSVWERLAAKHPVLRTRIIPCDASKPLQVIVKEKITWNRGTSLEKYMKKDEQISMTYGGRLLRYGLIDQGTDERLFVLTSHHAIYDRWTIKTILTEVDQMYKDKSTVEPVPFQRFIKYVETRDLDKSAAYWEEQLGGNTPTTFPSLPFPSYQPHPNEQLQLKVAFKRAPQSNTLISNLLRAAWAITLAEATKSDDVVFIASINSRGIPVRDIDDIVGPTLTVEPIRVKINPSQSVPAYLDSIQTQAMDMIPFEQTGLTEMRRLGLSDKHLFLVQPLPGEDDMCEILGEPVGTGFLKDFDPFALVMECSVADEGVFLEARYDGVVFSYEQMQSVLERFATVMTFIAKEDESKRLRDIYQHEVAEVEKQVKRDSQLILNGTLGKKDLEDTIDLWYLKQPMIQTRSYAESDEEISSLESTSERIALY